MEWLMEDALHPGAGLSLAKMTVAAGQTSERHKHPDCTETIHVLSGQIQQLCGKDWITLTAGQTCLIPKNHLHQTRNIGSAPAVMILAYSSGSRIYEPA